MGVKKIALIFFGLVLLAVLCGGGLFAWSLSTISKSGPLSDTKIIIIERGKGISAIAQKLKDDDIISSATLFKIATVLDNDDRPLKAGEYEFIQNISMAEVLDMLRSGKVYDRKITFPEGLTVYQILKLLKEKDDLIGDVTIIPNEGTLMPDTYHYVGGQTRDDIIKQMSSAMEKTLEELWPIRAQGLPIQTQNEALILASIVEKETGVADERAKIAGVFINRLRLGMPLQTDPTVIYAMTLGKIQNDGQGPIGRRLLSKDLAIDSPYNTYKNVGLPPTPIANPGRAAIKATLNPENHDYIYFVADGTGGHAFARTLAEHNSNVAKWRKIRKSQ